MKNLESIISKLDYEIISGSLDGVEISDIIYDSRKVTKDCLFVCLKGASFDAHRFANDAVLSGAAALLVSEDIDIDGLIPVIKVADTRAALSMVSAAFFDYPANSLKVIGITGTKGKTTTTYMVKSIMENAGLKVGLMGTIETIIGDEHTPAGNTTPESYVVQSTFRKMLDNGLDYCVMEVSSQGLMTHRVDGFTFEIGVFTNIEPDHIGPNEHKDFDDYLECKSRLFKRCNIGLVNADDSHVNDILRDHTCKVSSYGIESDADYKATNISYVHKKGYLGVAFDVEGNINLTLEVDLPGKFSVYNSLCALAICDKLGVPSDMMEEAIKDAKVKGRIEMIPVRSDLTLMIDYAHNAMSLKSLLTTLKSYDPGRIVTVFGCGGNRDKHRRYEMGEVSGNYADFTIITSDNPRDEEPEAILDDIELGMKKTDGEYIKIADRKEAIRYAIVNGKPRDVIILAGKGHEDYQEIKGVKYPMDERVLVAEIIDEEGIVY